MKATFDTPVLFLLFNRPDLASRVFDVIRNARPRFLFIAVDGPRENHVDDENNCARCRALAASVDWPCNVHTLFRTRNLGCKNAVKEAINWFFENVSEGIILEDDCIPHPTFFPYCAELLSKFRHNRQVLSISGCNMGNSKLEASYGFTPFMNMWGWATWGDRAALIDYEGSIPSGLLANFRLFLALQRGRPHFWHLDFRWFLHWRKSFIDNAMGVTNFWDPQWIYFGLINWKVSIFPTSNLIQNVGFGNHATATTDVNSSLAGLRSESISLPLIHPGSVRYSRSYELDCIRRKWSGYSPSFIQDIRTIYFYSKLASLKLWREAKIRIRRDNKRHD